MDAGPEDFEVVIMDTDVTATVPGWGKITLEEVLAAWVAAIMAMEEGSLEVTA